MNTMNDYLMGIQKGIEIGYNLALDKEVVRVVSKIKFLGDKESFKALKKKPRKSSKYTPERRQAMAEAAKKRWEKYKLNKEAERANFGEKE